MPPIGFQKHRLMSTFNYNEDFILAPDELQMCVMVWDSRTGEIVQKLTGHNSILFLRLQISWWRLSPSCLSAPICSLHHLALHSAVSHLAWTPCSCEDYDNLLKGIPPRLELKLYNWWCGRFVCEPWLGVDLVKWVAASTTDNSVMTCSNDHRARFWTDDNNK